MLAKHWQEQHQQHCQVMVDSVTCLETKTIHGTVYTKEKQMWSLTSTDSVQQDGNGAWFIRAYCSDGTTTLNTGIQVSGPQATQDEINKAIATYLQGINTQ